jgi:ADP-ribose pyrophosphatase YjhB (NUDIX family)
MKALLLKVWKWLPFGLQRLFSHILLPSFQVFAVAVIFNSDKQILLGKATYQRIHPWGLPGGSLKLGEEPEQAVVREMLEETGLNIEVKNLLMAKNSSARDQIGLFYWCNILGGEFHPSDEISEIQYFDVNKLPDVYPSDITLIKRLSERVNCIENELA